MEEDVSSRSMKRALSAVFALVALASSAAEVSVDGKEWRDSPEAYFMTRDERREWELVKSEEDAKRFIDAFRARRDPDFAAEVLRRAALVDERLALGEVKASTTIRGKIAILLGAPAELRLVYVPRSPYYAGTVFSSRKGGATYGPPQPSVIGSGPGWVDYTFQYSANPRLGVGPWTVVIEANAASGKDRFKYPWDKKKADDILDAAAHTTLRSE
jgi:hypothetical protein